MNSNYKEYTDIKDNCRNGLLKYLKKAISIIPQTENLQILDVGCGSGIPTLFISEELNSHITAIDTDLSSIDALRLKIEALDLCDRINLINCSLFDIDFSLMMLSV